MRLLENLRMALEGLRANKMRAILTMLGIIIGISAVIGILTVGDGLSGYVTGTMTDFGASTISVSLQQKKSDLSELSLMSLMAVPDDEDLITDKMIAELQSRLSSDIAAISLTQSVGSGKVKDGHLYANVSVSGTNEGTFKVANTDLLAGRLIQETDNEGQRNVCVVSDKLVNNMFAGNIDAALGSEIKLTLNSDLMRFRIVGIYAYEQSAFSFSTASEKDISTTMYIPISTAKYLAGAPDGYSSFSVMADPEADSRSVSGRINDLLNRYYRNNDKYRVNTMSMESMIESVDSIMDTLSTAISVIAAISLLVGGIGVMNIMLVSVTERTREIGTRKALGATNGDIRAQFVVESMIICLIGGIIGILLGTVMGYVGSTLLKSPSFPSFSSIALAVGFSLIVGVFFGYYPAKKAAMLDPIDALRYE